MTHSSISMSQRRRCGSTKWTPHATSVFMLLVTCNIAWMQKCTNVHEWINVQSLLISSCTEHNMMCNMAAYNTCLEKHGSITMYGYLRRITHSSRASMHVNAQPNLLEATLCVSHTSHSFSSIIYDHAKCTVLQWVRCDNGKNGQSQQCTKR